MFKKKNLLFTIATLLLLVFTAYVLADTFLITRVYSSVEYETSIEASTGLGDASDSGTAGSQAATVQNNSDTESTENSDAASQNNSSSGAQNAGSNTTQNGSASSEAISTATTYQDDNISITLTEYTAFNTSVYVADVQLSDASYLQTALAQSAYGRNVSDTTSNISDSVGAILAINGDNYGSQRSGYVLRNGTLYRNTAENGQEDLVIYEDGSFGIVNESKVSAEELVADGAVQILSFGPALIENGSIAVSENEEVGKAKASNPRTAIGIIDDLHYVFVVSDGSTDKSEGLSLYQLAQIMKELGAETAYNLDGGGSSTMYFNGQVINNPTTSGNSTQERKVSDIVYIGY